MPVPAILTAVFSAITSLGGSYLENRSRERATKLEIKKIEAEGRVEQARALAVATANYDNYAQQQMSRTWKDEYLVVLISFPYIVSFLTPFIELAVKISYAETITPRLFDMTSTLAKSWELVGQAPDWYQWSFMGIVIATFGLRWAAGGFTMPKLGKKDA